VGQNASDVAVSHTFLAGSLQLGQQRMKSPVASARRPVDSLEGARTASRASLRYVSCSDSGIRRVKRGKGFVYFLPNGRRVTDARELDRIRKLALPPAWRDVWICTHRNGHLQATGFDARGRKQYRYDTRWRAARDETKYHELLDFAAKLPRLRQRLNQHIAAPGLTREKVLATVVSLMAQTGVRVGNDRYTAENGSFGLTTLLDRHAKIASAKVELVFRGKGGKPYRATVRDPRLARIVRRCRDVPGQRLFQYVAANGAYQFIGSGDVNQYLSRIFGQRFTAKTFRTWIASVITLQELRAIAAAESRTSRKRQLNVALGNVAEHLGNTVAICRKSYVHPVLMQSFLDGQLMAGQKSRRHGLSEAESDLVAVLESSLRQRAAAA
jgi:DNA topoisomerase I